MENKVVHVAGMDIPVYEIDTLIIGSGCAGFNAADWLYDLGKTDIALLTEGLNKGTSRNTGSDKQTYYKLSIAGSQSDSVEEMAQTLTKGIGVNGDNALIEAAGSLQAFFKLVNLGVPFPTNLYGEFVGYKTDHDFRQRATSAGPLTSKYMTEALEESVRAKGVKIMDRMQAVRILTQNRRLIGILAYNLNELNDAKKGFVFFRCQNAILATGGPASVYHASVFPESQTGATGMAIEAGATLSNFQEWQYGLASTQFRWNVSGTYQQVLPRFIAIDGEQNEREFLTDYFDDPYHAVDMVFLKGYQWPFDVAKISGSSQVDLMVHHETAVKGNRVFMDFTRNPSCIDSGGFGPLSAETRNYLEKSNALSGTPIERLQIMNPQAIELYKSHNIDITKEPLEVAVCAQHSNGGLAVDINWQTEIEGLYAAGEAAGTFGVYRPGGSALNSAQVGSMRAAQHIAFKDGTETSRVDLQTVLMQEFGAFFEELLACCGRPGESAFLQKQASIQKQMSRSAAHIRNIAEMGTLMTRLNKELELVFMDSCAPYELPALLKYRDMLITQIALLSSMITACGRFGSRGSALLTHPGGQAPSPVLQEYRFIPTKKTDEDLIVYTRQENERIESALRTARPIPVRDLWFETAWNDYNTRKAEKK